MRKKAPPSIKTSMTLVLFILVGLTALAPVAGLIAVNRSDYYLVTNHGIRTGGLSRWAAQNAAHGSEGPRIEGSVPSVFEWQRIRLTDQYGNLSYDPGWENHSEYCFQDNPLRHGTPPEPQLSQDPSVLKNGIIQGSVVYSVTPVIRNGNIEGYATAFSDKTEIRVRIRQNKLMLLSAALAALLFSVGSAVFIYLHYTRPVSRLASDIDSCRIGEGSDLPVLDRTDEIGRLSESFGSLYQRLAEKNRMISAFTSDIFHELKNPISGIRNGSEVLLGRCADPESRVFIEAITAEAARMEQLLFAIKEIGVYEELDYSEFESRPAELLRKLAVLYPEGLIIVRQTGNKTESPSVNAPPEDLFRAFRNITDNAVDFSPENESVLITSEIHGKVLRIRISDKGSGIKEEDRSRIFRRFYSDRPDQCSRNLHTGLGLPIAEKIITAAGGRISVEDNRPSGAVFTIELPCV